MRDDARTRAHEVLFAAFGSGGSIIHVNPYHAVDALLAAGWRPPVSDDTKAKARSAMTAALTFGLARTDGTVTTNADVIGWYVAALADAGLLAEPSHLDRLAAWADEHNISVDIVRAAFTTSSGTLTPWAASAEGAGTEFDEDVQEAARRILARLEGRES